jgi:broad specificity phosphatase PhoE
VLDAGLRERNWGSWEGLTGPERDRVEYVGEAPADHAARVLAATRAIAERHPGRRVVVVTHGGSLRRIQVAAYGMALPVVENCAVWAVAHEDGAFRPIDLH